MLRTTAEPGTVPPPDADDGSHAVDMQSTREGIAMGATGSFEPPGAAHVQGTSPLPVEDSGQPAAPPVVAGEGVAAFSQQGVSSMPPQGVDTAEVMPAAQPVTVLSTVVERRDEIEQAREHRVRLRLLSCMCTPTEGMRTLLLN